MASRRQIIGGLASVLLHGALLGWVATRATEREADEPVLVTIERIELASITEGSLAARAAVSSPGEDAPGPAPARGEDVPTVPELEPATTEPSPSRPPQAPAMPAPHTPASEPSPTTPTADDPVQPEPPPTTAADDPAQPEPLASTTADDPAGRARAAGTSDGHGSTGSSIGRTGTDESPDHAAYGAELVRLVKAEIDTNPVPGLRPHDAIEVVLEVLPSGRLARHGLGKYDYAQVVRSTLGPVRLRALLRRIHHASQAFPPHPSSFPRQRYVVGFTVRFRELHG